MFEDGTRRVDLRFPCGEDTCAGWLFLPPGVERPPVVVMGTGFSGTRAFAMPTFARVFASRGLAAFAFDYRHFGDSGGAPRQLVDPWAQLDDWRSALALAGSLGHLDGGRARGRDWGRGPGCVGDRRAGPGPGHRCRAVRMADESRLGPAAAVHGLGRPGEIDVVGRAADDPRLRTSRGVRHDRRRRVLRRHPESDPGGVRFPARGPERDRGALHSDLRRLQPGGLVGVGRCADPGLRHAAGSTRALRGGRGVRPRQRSGSGRDL
jgi:hypothetical protein